MANLRRDAKSGNNWSQNELLAFNIRVIDVGIPTFLNTVTPGLPPPTVSATILTSKDKPDEPLAKNIPFILHILDYDDQDRVICRRMDISFPMAGQPVNAKADSTMLNEDPEPQIIAKAIGAFHQNNLLRRQTGLTPLQSKCIPAVTMIGTAPIFYRINVTTALVQAVATASYPQRETLVLGFIPPVPNQNRYRIDGIRPLDNRRIILQCFEAFKTVI